MLAKQVQSNGYCGLDSLVDVDAVTKAWIVQSNQPCLSASPLDTGRVEFMLPPPPEHCLRELFSPTVLRLMSLLCSSAHASTCVLFAVTSIVGKAGAKQQRIHRDHACGAGALFTIALDTSGARMETEFIQGGLLADAELRVSKGKIVTVQPRPRILLYDAYTLHAGAAIRQTKSQCPKKRP